MTAVSHVQLCFIPFGGFGLPGITFPISFSLYFESESQYHGTPFPLGCMSPPPWLSRYLGWWNILDLFTIPLLKPFISPFQNISMEMFLQAELPSSEQHVFIPVTVILPALTNPWMSSLLQEALKQALTYSSHIWFSSNFFCFLFEIALALNDLFFVLPTLLVLLIHKLKDTYNLHHMSILQSLQQFPPINFKHNDFLLMRKCEFIKNIPECLSGV